MKLLSVVAFCLVAVLLETVECRTIHAGSEKKSISNNQQLSVEQSDLLLRNLAAYMNEENMHRLLAFEGCDDESTKLVVNGWRHCLNFTKDLIHLEEIGEFWYDFDSLVQPVVDGLNNFSLCHEKTKVQQVQCLTDVLKSTILASETVLNSMVDNLKDAYDIVVDVGNTLTECFHLHIPKSIEQNCVRSSGLLQFVFQLYNSNSLN